MTPMDKLVDRFSIDHVIFTQAMMEDDAPVLYISYKTQPEKKVVCKTMAGAQELGARLMIKPPPCRCCGGPAKVEGNMHSCIRCSIYAGTAAAWRQIMVDKPAIRDILSRIDAPTKACMLMLLEAEDNLHTSMAINALKELREIDMSAFFTEPKDARDAEERIRRMLKIGGRNSI